MHTTPYIFRVRHVEVLDISASCPPIDKSLSSPTHELQIPHVFQGHMLKSSAQCRQALRFRIMRINATNKGGVQSDGRTSQTVSGTRNRHYPLPALDTCQQG